MYVRSENRLNGTLITLLHHVLKIDLLEELRATLSTSRGERIVITGSEGYFAAGADIAELNLLDGRDACSYSHLGQSVMNCVANHQSPTIAAITGYCMGGGMDLSLACTLRYASAGSIFAHPGAKIGIITGWGGTHRLPQQIGTGRALELMTTGIRVNAREAFEWGLVNGVIEDPVAHAFSISLNSGYGKTE